MRTLLLDGGYVELTKSASDGEIHLLMFFEPGPRGFRLTKSTEGRALARQLLDWAEKAEAAGH